MNEYSLAKVQKVIFNSKHASYFTTIVFFIRLVS